MKIAAIFYTDAKYQKREEYLLTRLKDVGFDYVRPYNRRWLENTGFYIRNREILDMPKGGGYWLWKPYIILETMRYLNDGDAVFYMDAGDDILDNNIVGFIRERLEVYDYMIPGLSYRPINRKYIKKDCFVLLNADTEEFWNTPQNEAGTLVFKKTRFNEELLEDWLSCCEDKRILTDIPNICGENDKDFIEHKHDQSILSILTTKRMMKYDERLYLSMDFNAYTP